MELYERYLNGDDTAFIEILSIYRYSLILYIQSIVHNIDEAEDIADEVFYRLSIKRLSPKRSLKHYLYRTAHNLSVDALRRSKKMSDTPIEEHIIAYEHVEQEVLKTEQNRVLYRALSNLNPEYTQVIYLSYFEGFDNSSIAKTMNKSTRQIENLLYRAKSALKKHINKEQNENEDQ